MAQNKGARQRSGGGQLPNDFAHGGSTAKRAPRRNPPVNWANNENGSSRGRQGKG